jgi:antitoxin (DNA-binding transcriptional repressor) of toxin-antitoxin stability system
MELEPDLTGDLTLRDIETGTEVPVSVSDEAVARYVARMDRFVADAGARARRAGMAHLLVPARAGALDDALRDLVSAGVVR